MSGVDLYLVEFSLESSEVLENEKKSEYITISNAILMAACRLRVRRELPAVQTIYQVSRT